MKTANKLATVILVTLVVAVGAAFGAAALAKGAPTPPAPQYEVRVNADGKTFGSAANAKTPEEIPDLVLVIATNGREGYVWKSDLDGPQPKTPEEAAKTVPTRRAIPVYESDGKTQIGVFVIEPGQATGG